MREENVLKLTNRYEQQIALYKEMLSIVKKLHLLCTEADFTDDLAGEKDLNRLNRLLHKRQEKMDLIEKNQEEAQALKALYRCFPSPRTSELLEKIAEIEALLKEIAGLDRETQKCLSAKLNFIGQKLEEVQKRKKLNKVYYFTKQQKEGFFIDRSK
ncbi:MAG: flagellar protein FliT [Firmicutes bacterium]|nr:flagellar protein FliT [Bacillota bacterium]